MECPFDIALRHIHCDSPLPHMATHDAADESRASWRAREHAPPSPNAGKLRVQRRRRQIGRWSECAHRSQAAVLPRITAETISAWECLRLRRTSSPQLQTTNHPQNRRDHDCMTTHRAGMAESDWENFALEILAELGWEPKTGQEIAPGSGERESWEDLHIPCRMLDALRRLNPHVPSEYLQQALAEIVAPTSKDAIAENYRLHRWLVDGLPRDHLHRLRRQSSRTRRSGWSATDPDDNDWLAVNQVTVASRRAAAPLRRRAVLQRHAGGRSSS